MNRTQPPIVAVTDLVAAARLEPTTAPETLIETRPARFAVFKQADNGWVLRDYKADLDYPFHTKAAAIGGMELRLDGRTFLGSPSRINAYGEPLESVEVFA